MLVLEMVMMIVIKTEQKNYGVRKKKGGRGKLSSRYVLDLKRRIPERRKIM
jgi:hypothetical protein